MLLIQSMDYAHQPLITSDYFTAYCNLIVIHAACGCGIDIVN